MDLKDWVEEQTKTIDKNEFLEKHLIPVVGLDLANFEEYVEKRKEILMTKLKDVLN
jgi:hypothetical protein